ncbi:hypothetical protein GYH30_006454 [Glycine max]|uniref:CRAL-TRIO domain-containing protein n=2 Tax=Glycine subgen. Soja TaxID=1462606 RepID=K7KDC5_SOYBN|nr:hypothetical protein GYH30_006454 [Glycine max]
MDPLLAMFLEGLDSYQEKNSHQKVQLFHDQYYIQSHIQLKGYRDRVILFLTAISTIDDLNYSEKIDTYYIVNVPYVFLMCWKVVKPLLQERTRRKIQVLQGCGKEELLKQQAIIVESISPIKQGSFYVDIPKPDLDDAKIAKP